jgi:hypothetical protein
MTEHWPAVRYDRWGATCDTLHARKSGWSAELGATAEGIPPPIR